MQEFKKLRACGKKAKSPKDVKPVHLVPFLTYADTNLREYTAKVTSGEPVDWRIKEALLLLVGHLADEIDRFPDIRNNMQDFFKTHVIQELSSQ